MSDYCYCRVSTDQQSTDSQSVTLRERYPNATLVEETASGAKHRPALEALVARLERGDRLIVVGLDRLGRRTSEVLVLLETLMARGIILISLREGVDYGTPAGRLVMQVLVAVSELERSLTIERVKAGMAAAKARGAVFGAKPIYTAEQKQRALALMASGLSSRKTAKIVRVSYSLLNEWRRSSKEAA